MSIIFSNMRFSVLFLLLLCLIPSNSYATESLGEPTAHVHGYLYFDGKEPTEVTFSNVDGLAVVEGDIIIGDYALLEAQAMGLLTDSVVITGDREWENGVVPYQFKSTLPDTTIYKFNLAIEHWEKRTGLDFIERTSENMDRFVNYIEVNPSTGCSSYVGRIGGWQAIYLAGGCSLGTTIHEIGHAIGFWHEQSREDRNEYVRVNYDNIRRGSQHNFFQHIHDGEDVGPYDYGSIMHYGTHYFSINGLPTIEPLDPNVVIGQRNGLSYWDRYSAVQKYGPVKKIEAEFYDRFFDNTPGNLGGVYKNHDVDIESTSDTDGGYNVAYTEDGEWLEYDVVLDPGVYDISARIASGQNGGRFSVLVNNSQVGEIAINSTNGWQTWATENIGTFTTTAYGTYTFRVAITVGGFNLNWLKLDKRCDEYACMDDDHDGVMNSRDQCPNTLTGAIVDAQGCALDGDGDGVPDGLDSCPNTRLGASVDAIGCEIPEVTHIVIEAEDYINYFDTSTGNTGEAYRNDDVDIENCSEGSPGYNVGWTEAGEYLEYQVFLNAGYYDISTRVASDHAGGGYRFVFDGIPIAEQYVNNTGGWQSWRTQNLPRVRAVTSRMYTIRIEILNGGFNLNWSRLDLVPEVADITVQAEDYDRFYDQTPGNGGQAYRDDDVDIEPSGDVGGGYNVGWVEHGEWLEYDVNLPSGTYDVSARAASDMSGGAFSVTINGHYVGTQTVSFTGGWQSWQTFDIGAFVVSDSSSINLRVYMDNGPLNLNWLRFVRQ